MVFIPALVGLGDVAVFLVVIIVLYALTFLVMALTGVLRYVPVVGPWIADNLVSHVGDALGTAGSWAVARLGDGIGLIWTPVTWLASLFGRIGEVLYEGMQAAERIVTITVPNAVNAVQGYAQQLYHQGISYTDATAGRLAQFATDLYHGSIAYTQQAVGAAEAQAQELYHQSILYTQAEAGALAQFSTDLYHGSISYTQQQVGAVESWVSQTVGTVQQDLLGRITTTQNWVQREVGALEHDISTAYDAATAYAGEVATAAVAPALAGVAAVDLALTKYLDECGTNLCKGLNPLSTALQALEPFLEGGLILLLAAEAARDAPGAAHEVIGLLEGAVNGIAREVAGAAGVRAA